VCSINAVVYLNDGNNVSSYKRPIQTPPPKTEVHFAQFAYAHLYIRCYAPVHPPPKNLVFQHEVTNPNPNPTPNPSLRREGEEGSAGERRAPCQSIWHYSASFLILTIPLRRDTSKTGPYFSKIYLCPPTHVYPP